MELPHKTKNKATIGSNNPTPGHISGQNYNSKRDRHPYVHSSAIHNSQDMKTILMSTDRGMDKANVLHIYNGTLLSH